MIQSAVKVSFFPYDLIFAVSYGVLVDVFGSVLKVRNDVGTSARRLTVALGLASTVLGVSIAYVFLALNLSPQLGISGYSTTALLEIVYLPIVIWGVASGALGGFVSARIWERNLKSRFKSVQAPL